MQRSVSGKPDSVSVLNRLGIRLHLAALQSQLTALKLEYVLAILIIACGAVLRLYRLPELMFFGPDQGFAANTVWQNVEARRPLFIGLGSSVGGFERGPMYTYLLIPAFVIGNGNPVSGALFIASLDVAAVILMFLVGRLYLGAMAGLVSASLYAVAPRALTYARLFWNPSPLPFFALLMLYALWHIAKGRDIYLLLLTAAWSVSWQIYEPPLLLLPVFLAAWLWLRPKIRPRTYFLAFVVLLITSLPLVAFNAQNGFAGLNAMLTFLLQSGSNKSGGLLATAPQRLQQMIGMMSTVLPGDVSVQHLLQVSALVGIGILFFRLRSRERGIRIFLLYLLSSLLFAFWPAPLDMRYLLTILPLPFLLVGLTLDAGSRVHRVLGVVSAVAVVAIVAPLFSARYGSLQNRQPDPNTYATISQVADHVLSRANGQPFSFRLYSVFDGAQGVTLPYEYLFKLRGNPPINRPDAAIFIVYSPQDEADGAQQPGTVINGVKVLQIQLRRKGPNLIVNGEFTSLEGDMRGWSTNTTGESQIQRTEDGLLILGSKPNDGLNAIQEIAVEPNGEYLIEFESRNLFRQPGSQRVYLTVADPAGNIASVFPDGGGFIAEPSHTWTKGAFIATIPLNGHRAVIWLRNRGRGQVWFRNIQVHQVSEEKIP